MENTPLIKWHTQELYGLIMQDQNNPLTGELVKPLKGILNSPLLRDVVSVDFVVSAEAVAAANEAELKRIQTHGSSKA